MTEDKEIPCPFCDKGNIKVFYTPSSKREVTTVYTKTIKKSRERYDVQNDCPHCGASASKIEKALNSGQDYKRPSKEKILERMKAAGLPTRI